MFDSSSLVQNGSRSVDGWPCIERDDLPAARGARSATAARLLAAPSPRRSAKKTTPTTHNTATLASDISATGFDMERPS